MPRDIPVGNGQMLVTFDGEYTIRDFYFPHVGMENHASGHAFRFGVWADQHPGDYQLSWMGPEWLRDLRYDRETLVTLVTCTHPHLQLRLHCSDAVDVHAPIFLRKVVVENLRPSPRQIKLFFHQNFNISGNDVGDTAFYDPNTESVVHYKSQRYFLANCSTDGVPGVQDFATGHKDSDGHRGTFRDADDGELSGNPIAQGATDSVIAVSLTLPASDSASCHYWLAAGLKYQHVRALNQVVTEQGPSELIKRTCNYWQLWANKEDIDFADLPVPLVRLFKRSQLIIRTQIDNDGAIIAANDSDIMQFNRDTYSYMWPRDGALTASALIQTGHSSIARQFFRFCDSLLHPDGYFMQKYNPDGSLASSWHPWAINGQPHYPFQEDETALVIWALWQHFDQFRDVEFITPLYRHLIIGAGQFMMRHRDHATNLPLPSFDLWEERYGIHTFTVCTVIAALKAAAQFASAFGETENAVSFQEAAEQMSEAAIEHLFDASSGRFARSATLDDQGNLQLDMTLDSSLAGLFLFGAYPADDRHVVSTMEAVRDGLWVTTPVGGMARYTNDYYYAATENDPQVPGNPWFITTLWMAQWEIARARQHKDLTAAFKYLNWCVQHASASGVLAEQVHPYTNLPISVSPLTWSHATFVATIMDYLQRRKELLGEDGIEAHRHRRLGQFEPGFQINYQLFGVKS